MNEGSLPILQDFNTFIKYIEEEKPVLTAKRGVFGKKDSFKLNSKLNYKRNVTAPNYTQDQYSIIDLMFSLAIDSGLYVVGNNEREKPYLVKTDKVESFLELNNYEKYVFLLENYWSKYNFNKKYSRWFGIKDLYYMIESIGKGNLGKPILKQRNTEELFSTEVSYLHHLSFFGLCELELIEGVKTKDEDSVKAVIPTKIGITVCKKLSNEGLFFWNIEDLDIIMDHLNIKKKKRKNENLFSILKSLFPDNIVKKTIENKIKINRSGVYTFKVSLSRSLWRKIRMSHKNTFEDLHNAIQQAFDFDNDHMYEFYIGGSRRNAKITYTGDPYNGIEDDITIGEANLYKGQKIIYLFDFGDHWEFSITVTDINDSVVLPIKPEIIESKGQSPEQYPEW